MSEKIQPSHMTPHLSFGVASPVQLNGQMRGVCAAALVKSGRGCRALVD